MTSARLNRLSVYDATRAARATFGLNFSATRRAGLCEVRFDVPGHPLALGLVGAGKTWTEAFVAAGVALGLAAFRSHVGHTAVRL